jgi:hypothetical protein
VTEFFSKRDLACPNGGVVAELDVTNDFVTRSNNNLVAEVKVTFVL